MNPLQIEVQVAAAHSPLLPDRNGSIVVLPDGRSRHLPLWKDTSSLPVLPTPLIRWHERYDCAMCVMRMSPAMRGGPTWETYDHCMRLREEDFLPWWMPLWEDSHGESS